MTADRIETKETGKLRLGDHRGTYSVETVDGKSTGVVETGRSRARFECSEGEVDDLVIEAFMGLVKREAEKQG